jgi:hypothetical protein
LLRNSKILIYSVNGSEQLYASLPKIGHIIFLTDRHINAPHILMDFQDRRQPRRAITHPEKYINVSSYKYFYYTAVPFTPPNPCGTIFVRPTHDYLSRYADYLTPEERRLYRKCRAYSTEVLGFPNLGFLKRWSELQDKYTRDDLIINLLLLREFGHACERTPTHTL